MVIPIEIAGESEAGLGQVPWRDSKGKNHADDCSTFDANKSRNQRCSIVSSRDEVHKNHCRDLGE